MNSIDQSLIGRQLLEMQTEIRIIRERALSHSIAIADVATKLGDLGDRIARFEASIETRMDQTERSIGERLTRIEAVLVHLTPPA